MKRKNKNDLFSDTGLLYSKKLVADVNKIKSGEKINLKQFINGYIKITDNIHIVFDGQSYQYTFSEFSKQYNTENYLITNFEIRHSYNANKENFGVEFSSVFDRPYTIHIITIVPKG